MKALPWNCSTLALLYGCILGLASFESKAKPISAFPFEVGENLISFYPKIMVTPEVECQGFRMARVLVATSPSCVRKIGDVLKEERIDVLDTKGSIIGSVSSNNSSLMNELSEPDLLLTLGGVTEDETYFDTPLYTGSFLPDQSSAFFFNEQGAISSENVTLSFQGLPDKKGYLALKSENRLPAGTPVFDVNGSLVCFATLNGECRALAPGLVHRTRTLKNAEDDYALAAAIPYIIMGAIVVGVTGISTVSFYVILLVRASYLGIPAGQYCQGICSCGYCSGWTSLSTVFCVIGGVLCPVTNGIYTVPFWWSAAFTAAWKWLNDLAAANQDLLLPVTSSITSESSDDEPMTQ